MSDMERHFGYVPETCDLCDHTIEHIFFDCRTLGGPWGNLCLECFKRDGVGLGLGKGRKYVQIAGCWFKCPYPKIKEVK